MERRGSRARTGFSVDPRLWKAGLAAGVLGLVTWLLLEFLLPARVPADYPGLPDLSSHGRHFRALITAADAEARKAPNSPQAVGKVGLIYHANQMYDAAIAAYGIAVRLAPDDHTWMYYKALAHEENGQGDAAFECLQNTAVLAPDYLPALQRIADTHFKSDRLGEAAACYGRMRSPDGGTPPQALFGLARVAERQRNWRDVVQYAGTLARSFPRFRPPHQLLANAYQALGMMQEASGETAILGQSNLTVVAPLADPLSDSLIEYCCSSTRLLKYAGFIGRSGNSEQVIRLARRAVEVDPADADARHFLSRTLLETHGADPRSVQEALMELNEGLRLRPDDLKPVLTAAAFFFKQNKTESAVEQLRSMLARNADDPEAHFYLGVAADHQGKTQEAIGHYGNALKKNPNYAEACNRLGLIAVRRGEAAEALSYFEKAVRLKPSLSQARCNLGVALEQRGRTGEAIAQYNEVLRLDPDDLTARMNLGLVLGRSGKFRQSEQQFREAVRINPRDAEAHFGLGCALAAQGKNDEALEEFRGALEIRPDYREARSRIAELTGRLQE